MAEWKNLKDSELADEAQLGLRGQGAVVEMMRRLKDSTNFLSYVGIALTVVGLVLTAVQIWKH
jgi:hypothetical protein